MFTLKYEDGSVTVQNDQGAVLAVGRLVVDLPTDAVPTDDPAFPISWPVRFEVGAISPALAEERS